MNAENTMLAMLVHEHGGPEMLRVEWESSGSVDPIDPQLLNQKGSLVLTRPSLGHYTATREELLRRAGDLYSWTHTGDLSVRIGAEFDLTVTDAADAHRALQGRRTTGKVVLRTRRAAG